MNRALVVSLFIFIYGFAQEVLIEPQNVLSVITEDWNNDGRFDRAVLVISEEDEIATDLYLYLSDFEIKDMQLALHKKDIAWRGILWGTQPSLGLNEKGSLLIESKNEAIGRNRWFQTLTIAYRNNDFIVAGFSYNAYDTLDIDYLLECDINLLTGKGIKNGEVFKLELQNLSLADWPNDFFPRACQE